MIRIAFPIKDKYLATVLDFSSSLLVVDIENGQVKKKHETDFNYVLLPLRANKLKDLKVNTIICGAVSNSLSMMIWHLGINIINGITGNVDQVIDAYINERLYEPKYLMPGFRPGKRGACGFGRRKRFRRGRCW